MLARLLLMWQKAIPFFKKGDLKGHFKSMDPNRQIVFLASTHGVTTFEGTRINYKSIMHNTHQQKI